MRGIRAKWSRGAVSFRIVQRLVFIGLIAMLGCSEDRAPAPTSPGRSTAAFPREAPPLEQRETDISRNGVIVYRDLGVVCVLPGGGYVADPALAGLWVMDRNKGFKMRLTDRGYNPRWSPDGERIAFEDGAQIYVIDRDGLVLTRITTTGRNFCPTWSPDGTRIAYESDREGGHYRLVSSGVDGRYLGPVGQTNSGDQRMADWNPATGQIVCVGFPEAGGAPQLFLIDPSGVLQQLTKSPEDKLSPRFSPDGKSIVFSASSANTRRVSVLSVEGGPATIVSEGEGWDPTWFPTGDGIAYTRVPQDPQDPTWGTVWQLNLETKQEGQLTFRHPRHCQ